MAEINQAVDELGPTAVGISHDVTDFAGTDEFIARAAKKAGSPISILVNNAGIHLKKPAVEITMIEFESVLRTHVLGAHALSAAVLPGMLERKHGSILFTASMASLFGIPLVLVGL